MKILESRAKDIKLYNSLPKMTAYNTVEEFVQLAITVDGRKHWMDFLITDLGNEDVILGLPWLRQLNPIDWAEGLLSIHAKRTMIKDISDPEERAISGITVDEGISMETKDEEES